MSIQESERDNNVVSFDCGAKPKVCAELGIISYPAIRLYRPNGIVDRYRGPRKAKQIVAYLRRMLRPSITLVTTKNITSFLSVDDVVLVGHITADDKNLRERFDRIAQKYHDRYSFALSKDVDGQSGLACYNNVDDVQRSAAELGQVEALEQFVKLCATPLIPELTRRSEMHYLTVSVELRLSGP